MAERCAVCRQGTAHEIVAPDEVRVAGARLVIADDRRMRCDHCAEGYYTGEQADEHQRKVDRDPSVLEFLAARSGIQLPPKGRPGRKKASESPSASRARGGQSHASGA